MVGARLAKSMSSLTVDQTFWRRGAAREFVRGSGLARTLRVTTMSLVCGVITRRAIHAATASMTSASSSTQS